MYILSMSMFTSLSIQNHDCQKLFSYFLPWKLRQWQTEWEMAKVGRSLKSEVTKFHACRRCHLSWSLLLLLHQRASLKSELTKIIHSRCCPLSPLLSHIKSSNQEKSCNIWCGLNEKGTQVNPNPGNQTTLISKKYVYAPWPPLCDWASFERANYSAAAKGGISTWFCCVCFKLANIYWPLTFHETFRNPSCCISCKMYTFAKYIFILRRFDRSGSTSFITKRI